MKSFLIILLMIVLVSGLAAAETLVAGSILKGYTDDVFPKASVSIVCGSKSLHTISGKRGAYAVRFSSEDCPLDSKVIVIAHKEDYSGQAHGFVENQPSIDGTAINVFLSRVDKPEKPAEEDEEELYIDSINLPEIAYAGDYLELSVNTETDEEVTVTATIPGLGIKRSKKTEGSVTLPLLMPRDAEGTYDLRITISNDNIRRVKHRQVRIL